MGSKVNNTRLYVWILIASIALSFGGIWVAIACKLEPTDGTRGGALTMVIAFFILIRRKDVGFIGFKAALEQYKTANPGAPMTIKVFEEIFIQKLKVDASSQQKQNVYLFWASAFGTFVWGFGDLFVRWMQHAPKQ